MMLAMLLQVNVPMFFILQEKVHRIHENNPTFAQGHLDQDSVA